MTKAQKRAKQYFQEIEQNMPDIFILKKLHSFFQNRKEIVMHLVDTHADDETIRQTISDVFGIMGGGSNGKGEPKGWYDYAGGKNPRLTIQDKDFVTVDELKGQKLIDAFRNLYRIADKQLYLF